MNSAPAFIQILYKNTEFTGYLIYYIIIHALNAFSDIFIDYDGFIYEKILPACFNRNYGWF